MHNCKVARNSFVELAVNELEPAESQRLLSELNECGECRAEYATLASTLHVSTQALRSSSPPEEFWTGYNQRLNARLIASDVIDRREQPVHSTPGVWATLRSFATASVSVPVPVALALVLLVGISWFAVRSREAVVTQSNAQLPARVAETIAVPPAQEKPQERIVTRVVYLEKPGRRPRRGGNSETNGTMPAAVARAEAQTPQLNLVDFKPTDQVKLTVIKGAYKDEK
jgi:hypothetical protein